MRGSTQAMAARRTGARTLVAWTAAALALLALLWPGAARGEGYPRLANIYFGSLDESKLDSLARWDLLVCSRGVQDV